MSKSNHTPLPWRYEQTRRLHAVVTDEWIVADCGEAGSQDDGQKRANAEFIVRAVNSHDELVAALEQIARLGMEADRSTVDVATMLAEIASAALEKVVRAK